jgi:hypothetical protein
MCPASRLAVITPRFDAKASFNESFTTLDGSGRMAISTMTAGANGLAAFAGELTYKGPLTDVRGRVKLAAQRSRMGTIYADRTRLDGGYQLGIRDGTFAMVGDFEDAVYCWRTQAAAWPVAQGGSTFGVLLATGAGALGVQLGGPVPAFAGDVDPRPEIGVGDAVEVDVLPSAVGLVWRALILWLLLVFLLSLANWAA